MTRPGTRGRALLFALLAVACALGSVAFASRYTGAGEDGIDDVRQVVVNREELSAEQRLTTRRAARVLEVREIPARYVPPDALSAPGEAVGTSPHATVPAGSYLLVSQLSRESAAGGVRVPRGLQPIEIAVSGAGALGTTAPGSPGARQLVDVVAADEPGSTVNPRVRVLARMVPLLALERRGAGAGGTETREIATLAVSRSEALAVIEAENFAREIRLLPRGPER